MYAQLLPDTPTQTSIMCHDVDVGDAEPIKQGEPTEAEAVPTGGKIYARHRPD